MRKLAAVFPLLFTLSGLWGCNPGKNAIVVIDEQWAVKQAQNDCQSRQRQGVPLCSGDPTSMIRDLELQTTQAFKGNLACNGLTLVTLNVSEDPSRLNSRHTWWLFLELMRSNDGPNELRYTVSSDHEPHRLQSAKGQGQPDSIVWEFCSFVRKDGNIE